MKIKRKGIVRICTERDYERKFKSQGYEVVEEVKEVEEVPFSMDNTKAELIELLKEKDLPIYGTKKELIDRLKEGE